MSFSRELYEKTHKGFISKPYKLSVDVRVFPHLDWIQARITPNKDTFHVASKLEKNGLELFFVSRLSKKTF